jgi:hypothetical protein
MDEGTVSGGEARSCTDGTGARALAGRRRPPWRSTSCQTRQHVFKLHADARGREYTRERRRMDTCRAELLARSRVARPLLTSWRPAENLDETRLVRRAADLCAERCAELLCADAKHHGLGVPTLTYTVVSS